MMNPDTTNDTAAVTAQEATVGPEKTTAKKDAAGKKRAPKRQKKATSGTPGKRAKTGKKSAGATPSGGESKGDTILGMIRRTKGATLAELMAAAGWQAHSVRGFISIAGKKQKMKIESSKNEAGERVYRAIR